MSISCSGLGLKLEDAGHRVAETWEDPMCPSFPYPSFHVLYQIEKTDDQEVDRWIERLIRLADKLEACKDL